MALAPFRMALFPELLNAGHHGAPRAKPVVPPQEYPPTPLSAEALPPSRSPLRRA